MKNPEIIVGIDRDAANLTGDPFVRQSLRPHWIGFEHWDRSAIRLRRRVLLDPYSKQRQDDAGAYTTSPKYISHVPQPFAAANLLIGPDQK
jgi:hypothetical protein